MYNLLAARAPTDFVRRAYKTQTHDAPVVPRGDIEVTEHTIEDAPMELIRLAAIERRLVQRN